MRVVFMGTPEFAVVSLNKLLSAGINIVGVVTVPDKPKGRGLKLQPSPVKTAAENAGIPVLQPESFVKAQCIAPLHDMRPDLIVVVAFKILPEEIFTIPPLGTINLHGSLLPKYRGAAPINWAIINGETETGVTTFFIQKKVDTGNMIMQAKIPIGPVMTAGELHDIMAVEGADLLVKTVQAVDTGNYILSVQDETLVSKAPKIHRRDCEINFEQPAEKVHNFIRGLSPYPAAYTFINGKMIKLYQSQVVDENRTTEAPGTRLQAPGSELHIACKSGIISVREVQLEGKRRMAVQDFFRGYQIEGDERFGEMR